MDDKKEDNNNKETNNKDQIDQKKRPNLRKIRIWQ